MMSEDLRENLSVADVEALDAPGDLELRSGQKKETKEKE